MCKNIFFDTSVYICTYNEEENIENCIAKIKGNGVTNIIVIDSSKNETTAEIAKKNGAIVIKAEKGLAGQRQIAIDDCKTKYLMFVDADDRIKSDCLSNLFDDMKKFGYDALQSSLRVLEPKTYWQKGMDANLKYCISIPGQTNMVGRPALYKAELLKKVGADTSFNNIGNEDSALSIRMEKIGAKQGISSAISYRYHPSTFKENYRAWKKYGYGDANLIKQYPEKTFNVIKHLLFVYMIKRSIIFVKNKQGKYVLFPLFMGIFRFLFMILGILKIRTTYD